MSDDKRRFRSHRLPQFSIEDVAQGDAVFHDVVEMKLRIESMTDGERMSF